MYTYKKKSMHVAFYQPIISFQSRCISGYEVLGRTISGNKVESLGAFFHDPKISEQEKLCVDRLLREQAISRVPLLEAKQKLFLNLKPSWIYQQYMNTGRLETLEMLERYHIDPERIVIEVTEEAFRGDMDKLVEIISLYRELGYTIAVDDIGSGFSNFDRIALLQPKIMKIDLKILKKGASHDGYKALLRSFSILSSQIGASLLVEGVETRSELHQALQVGARYVQGYFFSAATSEFIETDTYLSILEQELALFKEGQSSHFHELLTVEDELETILHAKSTPMDSDSADQFIEEVIELMSSYCIRMYICKEDGIQMSSNYIRESDGSWRKDVHFRGSNWVWRPHFIQNIIVMNKKGTGMLSSEYMDLDTSRLVQTYSFPLGDGLYLFMDVAV